MLTTCERCASYPGGAPMRIADPWRNITKPYTDKYGNQFIYCRDCEEEHRCDIDHWDGWVQPKKWKGWKEPRNFLEFLLQIDNMMPKKDDVLPEMPKERADKWKEAVIAKSIPKKEKEPKKSPKKEKEPKKEELNIPIMDGIAEQALKNIKEFKEFQIGDNVKFGVKKKRVGVIVKVNPQSYKIDVDGKPFYKIPKNTVEEYKPEPIPCPKSKPEPEPIAWFDVEWKVGQFVECGRPKGKKNIYQILKVNEVSLVVMDGNKKKRIDQQYCKLVGGL